MSNQANVRDAYVHTFNKGNTIFINRRVNGKRVLEKIKYEPVLYTLSAKPTGYKDIHGNHVMPRYFDSISDAYDFMREYDVSNDRIYGFTNWAQQELAFRYSGREIDWQIKDFKIAYLDIEVQSENGFAPLDDPREQVNAIGMQVGDTVYAYGIGKYVPSGPDIIYKEFDNDADLLAAWVQDFVDLEVDIVTGWNISGFDIPYLVNRIDRIFGEGSAKNLSPFGMLKEKTVTLKNNKEVPTYEIVGVGIIDYMQAYMTNIKEPRENHKLEYIGMVELDETKVDYREEGYDTLRDLYRSNFQMFMDYNIQDVRLVQKLEYKLRLIELIMEVAYTCRINYDDTYNQTRIWDSLIHHTLLDEKIVIPMKELKDKDEKFEGAYVKDPQVGFHHWVVSFDAASLYPSAMIQWNISPDTITTTSDRQLRAIALKSSVDSFLERSMDTSSCKEHNVTVSPNGQFFRKDKIGFIPKMLIKFMNLRKKAKDAMIDAKKKIEVLKAKLHSATKEEQEKIHSEIEALNVIRASMSAKEKSTKVLNNSVYGASGNNYFRWYDLRLAEAVTSAGRVAIKTVENKVNRLINELCETHDVDYVIGVDTDSVYINIKKIVDMIDETDIQKIVDQIDIICKEIITPEIESETMALADFINAYDDRIKMKREAIADRCLWIAKKRYIMTVLDNEGVRYQTPELKVMGHEMIKSSTPGICREALKNSVWAIMRGTEEDLQKTVKEFKDKFMKSEPKDIASPRGVSAIDKWLDVSDTYKSGTPVHVRGAIVFNRAIDRNNMADRIEKIKEGDKIKYAYLTNYNQFGEKYIAFHDSTPTKLLGIDDVIDYDMQFKKTYLEPLEGLTNIINWSTEPRGIFD